MENKKLTEQIEAVNQAFHKIWFSIMFERPDYKKENVQKLSFVEMHLIGLAYDKPDIIIKELREFLKVPQTTLSSIIAKLEKLGYIRRVINPKDMRSFAVEVTPKGKEIREMHNQNDFKQAKETLLALDESERETFVRLIQKVSNVMSSGRNKQ